MAITDVTGKARALYEARRSRVPIAPFTDDDPTLGMADGYAVQAELVELILAEGDSIIGYKAGLTSKPLVSEPTMMAPWSSTSQRVASRSGPASLSWIHRVFPRCIAKKPWQERRFWRPSAKSTISTGRCSARSCRSACTG